MTWIKLLNGDLIHLLSTTNTASVTQQVADYLQVDPEVVRLVKCDTYNIEDAEEESKESKERIEVAELKEETFLALVDASITVDILIPTEWHGLTSVHMEAGERMHPLFVDWCVSHFGETYEALLKCTHPRIVQTCILMFSDTRLPPTFSANPSDEAVDFLLSHPHHINLTEMSLNPNRRAIEYVMKTYTKLRDQGDNAPRLYQDFMLHPYDDVIEFAEKYLVMQPAETVGLLVRNPCPRALALLHRMLALPDPDEQYSRLWVCAQSNDEELLRECVESIRATEFQPEDHTRLELWMEKFFGNPHPVVVDFLIHSGWLTDATHIKVWRAVLRNPDEAVVERILAHPFYWKMALARPHPRIVERTVEWLKHAAEKNADNRVLNGWLETAIKNRHPKMIRLLLTHPMILKQLSWDTKLMLVGRWCQVESPESIHLSIRCEWEEKVVE